MGFAIYFKLGMTAGDCPAIQKAGPKGTIITAAGNSEEYPGQEQTLVTHGCQAGLLASDGL